MFGSERIFIDAEYCYGEFLFGKVPGKSRRGEKEKRCWESLDFEMSWQGEVTEVRFDASLLWIFEKGD